MSLRVRFDHISSSTTPESVVLCKFPFGEPPQIQSLNKKYNTNNNTDHDSESITFQYYANTDERKSTQRILIGQSHFADFVGKNYGEIDSNKFNTHKYAL